MYIKKKNPNIEEKQQNEKVISKWNGVHITFKNNKHLQPQAYHCNCMQFKKKISLKEP